MQLLQTYFQTFLLLIRQISLIVQVWELQKYLVAIEYNWTPQAWVISENRGSLSSSGSGRNMGDGGNTYQPSLPQHFVCATLT